MLKGFHSFGFYYSPSRGWKEATGDSAVHVRNAPLHRTILRQFLLWTGVDIDIQIVSIFAEASSF
jgi:hypothetical protein